MMRTDRNNNPTAMTTDVANTFGLKQGVDYVPGDPFQGGVTAKLLGNPISTTIRGLDNATNSGLDPFYTQTGQQRWTHTAVPTQQWKTMTPMAKRSVVLNMYQKEGGNGNVVQQADKFAKGVEAARSNLNLTDTQILDNLSKKYTKTSDGITQARSLYSSPNSKIINDRDLLNYLSQRYSGRMPTVPSNPSPYDVRSDGGGAFDVIEKTPLGKGLKIAGTVMEDVFKASKWVADLNPALLITPSGEKAPMDLSMAGMLQATGYVGGAVIGGVVGGLGQLLINALGPNRGIGQGLLEAIVKNADDTGNFTGGFFRAGAEQAPLQIATMGLGTVSATLGSARTPLNFLGKVGTGIVKTSGIVMDTGMGYEGVKTGYKGIQALENGDTEKAQSMLEESAGLLLPMIYGHATAHFKSSIKSDKTFIADTAAAMGEEARNPKQIAIRDKSRSFVEETLNMRQSDTNQMLKKRRDINLVKDDTTGLIAQGGIIDSSADGKRLDTSALTDLTKDHLNQWDSMLKDAVQSNPVPRHPVSDLLKAAYDYVDRSEIAKSNKADMKKFANTLFGQDSSLAQAYENQDGLMTSEELLKEKRDLGNRGIDWSKPEAKIQNMIQIQAYHWMNDMLYDGFSGTPYDGVVQDANNAMSRLIDVKRLSERAHDRVIATKGGLTGKLVRKGVSMIIGHHLGGIAGTLVAPIIEGKIEEHLNDPVRASRKIMDIARGMAPDPKSLDGKMANVMERTMTKKYQDLKSKLTPTNIREAPALLPEEATSEVKSPVQLPEPGVLEGQQKLREQENQSKAKVEKRLTTPMKKAIKRMTVERDLGTPSKELEGLMLKKSSTGTFYTLEKPGFISIKLSRQERMDFQKAGIKIIKNTSNF